ncbi:dihydropyrimidinase [Constrictibacter sp. MBR-5]|jgi:dihydropyrimidinase|uniref:dihydropyrimidinase n=1 Tax=Constrictibacter sp. MBR-5 TaxID=3156467 RepID=UPI0033915D01
MSMYDLVIRNGTVATADAVVKCDIGVSGGRVVALARDLGKGEREVDATGRIVMPGGVDSHCHIEQRSSSTESQNADTWFSGTTSAACGGTTTVIAFSPTRKGGTVAKEAAAYHELAKKAVIDYGLHIIVNDANDAVMAELPGLIEQGHRSIKMFMTYDSNFVDDAAVLKVLATAREHEAFVCVHAENHEAIKWMTARLLEAGLKDAKYHAWAKPPVVEREATHRIIALAEMLDQPIQVFHVTCGEAAEEIHRAQQRGLKVWGETCPQYLVLTADDMDRPDFEGAKYVCSPAPRTVAEQEALWGYLKTGVLDVITSDHAPYNFKGPASKSAGGTDVPFTKIPNGLPGVETRLPVVFSEGVSKGRIDLQTFVALTSANSAKLFGLFPKKGTIAVGSDADFAIWDPEREVTITHDLLHSATDYTPYEGFKVKGWPVMTFSRGRLVCEEFEAKTEEGWGQFLPRGPYPYVKPNGRFTTPFDPIAKKVG